MTSTKSYHVEGLNFKTHYKNVGQGFEVSLWCDGKTYFVSNFVHKKEAQTWWRLFNQEISTFSKKYEYLDEASYQWYCKFLANHLYNKYYGFLDRVVGQHNHTYKKIYFKDVKKYNKLKRAA